ncbi:hypothetical protein GCM10027269_72210 [Kribbella endophytica]
MRFDEHTPVSGTVESLHRVSVIASAYFDSSPIRSVVIEITPAIVAIMAAQNTIAALRSWC